MAIILVVDDDQAELERTAALIDHEQNEVLATSDEDRVEELLQVGAEGLVVDYRADDFSESSVELARKFGRARPDGKIVFVSNHFGSDSGHGSIYDKIPRMINPMAEVLCWRKSDLTEEVMAEWISEQLDSAAGDVQREPAVAAEAILHAALTSDVIEALSVSPAEWTRLSIDEQDDLSDLIATRLQGYILSLFGASEAEWVVIGGRNAHVLRWGDQESEPLGPMVLNDVRAREGVVPFAFIRHLDVDSISIESSLTDDGVEWPGSGKHEHYPAIGVRFAENGVFTGPVQSILFDTGADCNYYSVEAARALQIPLAGDVQTGYWGARPLQYRERQYDIELSDGLGRKQGTTMFRMVKHWSKNLGLNKHHDGLVSTLAIVDLSVGVKLSGSTRILSLEEEE